MRIRSTLLVALTLLGALVAPAGAAAAPTITEFPVGGEPTGVALGTDDNVWFTDRKNPGAIGRITPGGTATAFTAGIEKDGKPLAITAGPGGMWFSEYANNKIGRITAGGTVTEFPGTSRDAPNGIVTGPDGNLWYAASGNEGAIVRLNPNTGSSTQFSSAFANAQPEDITLGPDGNLWFTEPASRRIGSITPQGFISWSTVLQETPVEIAAGADGNLWFTETGVNDAISRIIVTGPTTGTITRFTTGMPLNSAPSGLARGADGAMYFTDSGANTVGRITTSGAISLTSAGLTASAGLRSIAAGADGRMWFAEQNKGKVGRISVAPAVGSVTPSSVTDVAATVSSTVGANSEATTYRFEYGLTTGYGSVTTTTSAGNAGAPQPVSASLTGLAPATTYHVRVTATNTTGTTQGPDRAFTTTSPGAPSATSLPASAVGASSATLNATVNPQNTATTYRFEWGSTDAPRANRAPLADAAVGADGADYSVAQFLPGLRPNTSYVFRVVATSAAGPTAGEDETFTTDAPAPDAVTGQASAVTTTSAQLAGTVGPRNSATTYRFEWGPTDAYGTSVPSLDDLAGDDDTPHDVSQQIGGLVQGTTYHFRLVATNNAGVTIGADQQFTTAAAPVVTEPPAAGPTGPITPRVPAPAFGRSAVASVTRGTIRFRAPGSAASVVLRGDATIPTGSVIDARNGTIALTSALDATGRTQAARFRGATFRMELSRRNGGVVDLKLTQAPTGCPPRGVRTEGAVARAAAARAKPPIKLWGSDRRGKYRTHGRNSVATVRGTEWTTTETCDGTVTRVVKGAVSVYDRASKRKTLVRAGHSYLAGPRT